MSDQKSIDGIRPVGNKNNNSTKLEKLAWVGMLFVVGSIAFSSYMVYFGSDSMIAKVLLIPQLVFAVVIAIYKFVK